MTLSAPKPAFCRAVTAPVSLSSLQPHTTHFLTPGLAVITAPVRSSAWGVPASVYSLITLGTSEPTTFLKAESEPLARSAHVGRSGLVTLRMPVSDELHPDDL